MPDIIPDRQFGFSEGQGGKFGSSEGTPSVAVINKVRRNLRRMIEGGAADDEIKLYLDSEGVTAEQAGVKPPTPPTGIPRAPFQAAGGMVGALAGMPFAPAFPPSPLITGALGAELAGQGVDLFNQLVLGVPDPRSGVQRAIESTQNIGLDIGLSGALPGIGPQLKRLGGAIISPVRGGPGARATLEDFVQAGIPIRGAGGAISGTRAVQATEMALSKLPTSARTMQVSAQRTSEALANELDRIVTGVGAARTKLAAGRALIKGVDSFVGRVRDTGKRLFNKIPIVGSTPVAMTNTSGFISENLAVFRNDPELASLVVPQKFQGILTAIERNDGRLTWEAVKRLRTSVGEKITDLAIDSDASKKQWASIYRVLSEDMEGAALAKGGNVLRQWEQAKRFWSTALTRLELIESVTRSTQSERAFGAALAGSRDGPTLLLALRKSVPKDLWGDFVSASLHQMGLANPGAQDALGELFSPRTFLTNWNRLSPGAKTAMFGRTVPLRRELDRLARITASFRDLEAVANPSGTASANVFMQGITTGFGTTSGFIVGGMEGAVVGGTASLAMPFYTAKLMQSESFVRWLAQGIQIAPRNFNSMATHLSRLAAIKAREPENAEAIDRIIEGLAFSIGIGESAPL